MRPHSPFPRPFFIGVYWLYIIIDSTSQYPVSIFLNLLFSYRTLYIQACATHGHSDTNLFLARHQSLNSIFKVYWISCQLAPPPLMIRTCGGAYVTLTLGGNKQSCLGALGSVETVLPKFHWRIDCVIVFLLFLLTLSRFAIRHAPFLASSIANSCQKYLSVLQPISAHPSLSIRCDLQDVT